MEVEKLFVAQLRNLLRISAGFHTVCRIRKQGIHDLALQHIIRGRKCALHLIVDDAVDHDRIILLFQLPAPPLLTEDLLIPVNIRIEHRIQIHIHQIPEILIIAAGYREHGFVRIGHGIEEGIHGSLHKLDKRILGRILSGAAQYGVFNDMRHAGGIARGRAERNVEDLIVIFIFNQHNACACLVMFQQPAHGSDVCEVLLHNQCIGGQVLQLHVYYSFSLLLCSDPSPEHSLTPNGNGPVLYRFLRALTRQMIPPARTITRMPTAH